MSNRNILVLGSKPDSKLPDIQVEKISTVNVLQREQIIIKKICSSTFNVFGWCA